MKQTEDRQVKKGEMEKENIRLERIEEMLQSAYFTQGVPEKVNIRLKNQIACRQAVEKSSVSFWWLPATVSTVISVAAGIIIYMIYVLVNIKGAYFFMPNLLQLISETWLKLHLAAVISEIILSWLLTFICIWKGSLVQRAKLL